MGRVKVEGACTWVFMVAGNHEAAATECAAAGREERRGWERVRLEIKEVAVEELGDRLARTTDQDRATTGELVGTFGVEVVVEIEAAIDEDRFNTCARR